MTKMRMVFLAAILALVSGCSPDHFVSRFADSVAFRVVGVAPVADVDTLTLKEIHLDNGGLTGRQVIVKGAVVSRSKHGTHLVMTDETARLLVVLTDLKPMQPNMREHDVEVVSIMGTVESGKKGLPFLKASAVHLMANPT